MIIPLWVFTFGSIIFQCDSSSVTYISFAVVVLFVLIALFIGALIQYFYPRAVKNAMQSLKWIILVYILSYDIVSIVRYWDMFTPTLFIFTRKVSEQIQL